jgi:flagellar hook-associated protein 1 FlgK
MSTQALGSALSGLRVTQRAIDVTSTNIANASTSGYTRKILPQEILAADGEVLGVRFGEIQRFVDQSVLRDYRVQLASQSYYDTREKFLERVVVLHGSTEREDNIGSQIGDLYNGFVELSLNPDNRVLQTAALNDARELANTFNKLSEEYLRLRNEVQASINDNVGRLNSILKDISSFNRKISSLDGIARSTATLEDERDELVKKVASMLEVSYYIDGNGTLTVQTRQGNVLVDNEPRTLTFDNQVLTYQTLYPDSLGGLNIIDSAGNAIDITKTQVGGSIGALLDLRDTEFPQYMAQLDELAHKMMMRFDAQGLRLFTDPTGVVPINDPAVYTGVAATIRVNQLVLDNPSLIQLGTPAGSVNPGSAEVILRVVDYAFGRNSDALGTPNVPFNTQDVGFNRSIDFYILNDTALTIEEFARSMLDHQAEDLTITKDSNEAETQYLKEVEQRFLDDVAVNTDEEMIKMIELQKAYGASAKMIGTINELFRDLMAAF